MASKFTVTESNTTVDFNWTAPTQTIQSIVNGASEYLWEKGYGDHGGGTPEAPVPEILFSSLTNTQKLALVENYLKQVVLDLANTQKSLKAQQLARETEEASRLSL